MHKLSMFCYSSQPQRLSTVWRKYVAGLCLLVLPSGGLVAAAGHAEPGGPSTAAGVVHVVPRDFATIQAAIDAAADGDTVLVEPGIYRESLLIEGKAVRLTSEFDRSHDRAAIRETVLSGEVEEDEENEGRAEQVLLIGETARPRTEIRGLTIEGGDDGIACYASVTIRDCRFVNNVDAIDYEGGGGLCVDNYFERNEDDAIDLDGDCAVTIERNQIVNNLDDGIEIRLQPYNGEPLEIVIRNNVIAGNAEDGIQIIDYPGRSDRHIRIERNLIARSTMAGIGMMSDAVTREDYRAADIPERIEIVSNSLIDNEYGITGSGNLKVEDNIFAQHQQAAIKTSSSQSFLENNLFWSNRSDLERIGTR